MNTVTDFPQVRLSDLLRELGLSTPRDCIVTGLTLDSREVRPGDLFCAVRGTRSHGLEFAETAVSQGAAAILAEPGDDWSRARIDELAGRLAVPLIQLPDASCRLSLVAGYFFGHPSRGMDVIAATGTNGKTSVCQFVAQAMADRSCGVIGTVGHGFPGALVAGTHTTPGPILLQKILADLRDRGARAVAMEVSSHALDQGRAAAVAVDTAIFTNLTRDHLDYHADMLDYAMAKRRLFHMPGLSHAVLNADDPFGLEILASLDHSVEPVLYGLNGDWQVQGQRWLRAELVEPMARGMRVTLNGSWGRGSFETRLLGRFNASNLLAVLAVLLLRGMDLPGALSRLENIRGVPGRMECFGGPGQPLVVVDYAHTPDALEQVLQVLKAHRPRRLITVFGCGGDRDRGKRPEMGASAEGLSDRVIVTDDNPRNEDGDRIVADILAGTRHPASIQVQRDRALAISQAVNGAHEGDIVLIAGKGHETTQTVGNRVVPFNDREHVSAALRARESAPDTEDDAP